MIKAERLNFIMNKLKTDKFIKVSEITEELGVTDMTVRRDLQGLEDQHLIIRVHGGAKLADRVASFELSHVDKIKINIDAKEEIARKIANEINDNETIFLGAGTTIELVHDYITAKNVKIITNSFHLFNRFKNDSDLELILIGGRYREKTGCFVGAIANEIIDEIYVQKAFIGINGVTPSGIYTFSESEGLTQQLILNNSEIKYIVGDASKFDRKDFYRFFPLDQVDYFITDSDLSEKVKEEYSHFINII